MKNSVILPATKPESGKPPPPAILTFKLATTRLPWGVIFILGGGFGMAEGVNVSGLADWIGAQLTFLKGINTFEITENTLFSIFKLISKRFFYAGICSRRYLLNYSLLHVPSSVQLGNDNYILTGFKIASQRVRSQPITTDGSSNGNRFLCFYVTSFDAT